MIKLLSLFMMLLVPTLAYSFGVDTAGMIGSNITVSGGATCTGIYGNSTVVTLNNEGGAPGLMIIQKVTIDCDSPASYTINTYGANDYGNEYNIILYDDDGTANEAGTKLAESGNIATALDETDVLFTQIFTTALTSGDYYIGMRMVTSNVKFYSNSPTGGITRQATDIVEAPATWPEGTDTHRTWNMIAYFNFD